MATIRSQAGPTVSVPFLDLGPTFAPIRESLLADIDELISSGSFVNGPQVESFERAFAELCGRRAAIGMASGLDALRLALLACGLEEGDEVIVPAMTFAASFEAVIQAGGRPLVVDVLDDDVGIDPAAAAAAMGDRTRFLMPVHLYGQMSDVAALRAVAARNGAEIVEDACQAHGAGRDGIAAGAAGIAAAFSFYPTKNLGAMGDAGAVVMDDETSIAKARALREHGHTSRYHSEYVGYTARLDTIQALVLTRKLPLLEGWNEQRRQLAAWYDDALADVGDLRLPIEVEGSTHVWHVYAVRSSMRDALGEFLASRGIGTNRHYPEAPHLMPAFADLGLGEGAFPVAEAIARETISLPFFPGMTEQQQQAVADAIREFFSGD